MEMDIFPLSYTNIPTKGKYNSLLLYYWSAKICINEMLKCTKMKIILASKNNILFSLNNA